MIRPLILLFAALVSALPVPATAERVRDLGQFQSVRSNQLTGYGIVVGPVSYTHLTLPTKA